jgi:plastocyanin
MMGYLILGAARRRRSLALVAIGLCLGLGLLAGLGGLGPFAASAAASGTEAVQIENYSFAPGSLTVPVGTTVTWTNHDEVPHTIVADDNPRSFRSAGLDTDDSFSFTFTKAGTYRYFCSVHPHMTGTIVVK